MPLTVINGSGSQPGIESDETAINTRSFSCRYFSEFQRHLPSRLGQTRATAYPDKWSREVRFSGEMIGTPTTGIWAAALVPASAFTPVNDVALYTAVAGGFYDLEVTEGQTREGWRDIDAGMTSHPERT